MGMRETHAWDRPVCRGSFVWPRVIGTSEGYSGPGFILTSRLKIDRMVLLDVAISRALGYAMIH